VICGISCLPKNKILKRIFDYKVSSIKASVKDLGDIRTDFRDGRISVISGTSLNYQITFPSSKDRIQKTKKKCKTQGFCVQDLAFSTL